MGSSAFLVTQFVSFFKTPFTLIENNTVLKERADDDRCCFNYLEHCMYDFPFSSLLNYFCNVLTASSEGPMHIQWGLGNLEHIDMYSSLSSVDAYLNHLSS